MKIAVAQINTMIGDFDGNREKILTRMQWAEDAGADLLVFPELSVCGYPPRDLLEKPTFVRQNLATVEEIAGKTGRLGVVLGYVTVNESSEGRGLFNSAGFLQGGSVQFVQHKALLPDYDVFDETRHFEPASDHNAFVFLGKRVGLTLCEDLWSAHEFEGRRFYRHDPAREVAQSGADIIINLSASPYSLRKQQLRRQLIGQEAAKLGLPIVYVNLVGGNDELVFDGRSFVVNAQGQLCFEGKAFAEDAFIVNPFEQERISAADLGDAEEVRAALNLGLRDYLRKCGFERVVIGLSGGIDSSVVAAIACEALGAERVMGVMMPSPYTSQQSVQDATALAEHLGMITCTVSIECIYGAYRKALGFQDDAITVAEENIQARIRGNILMAISNREGALVLSTGNKSELSVGYCTLYGDMAGGLALISDIPKTMVYGLARHINADREIIPQSILDRPPSAELRPDQLDQDSLPPYETLDPIMRLYVEERKGVEAIVAQGFAREEVLRIVRMIDQNEYKRRQAPPGIKITSKAFGMGRRLPIARK